MARSRRHRSKKRTREKRRRRAARKAVRAVARKAKRDASSTVAQSPTPRPTAEKPNAEQRIAETPRVEAPSAEKQLLALARDLSARAQTFDRTGDLATLAAPLFAAYADDAPLATALRDDWLRGRDDKTARLALAWAREQLRLTLVEVLQRARGDRPWRPEADVEFLAWLWLAACEALAHEPPAAAADRVHALVTFLRSS